MVLGTITPPTAAAPRHRVAAASRFRFPHALQLTGSGSGKPIKIRDRKAIKQGDRAHVQNRRQWVRLREKGGKAHALPCNHSGEEYLTANLEQTGIMEVGKGPLSAPSAAALPG
jgi:hypothetical protein